MEFDNDNLLDQFLQQHQQHAAQGNGAGFGVQMSGSNTPVPMNIPGSHAEGGFEPGFGASSVSTNHTAHTSSYNMGNELSASQSSFRNNNTHQGSVPHNPQSRQQSITGHQIEASNVPASFMDEYLSPGDRLNGTHSQKQAFEHINLDETTRNLFDEPMFRQQIHGSQPADDLMSNFTDDFVSSLGSSIHNDLMTPVSSYQPQPLDSFDSNSFSQMSSSLRSPSASYRERSQLSSSVRSNRGSLSMASSSLASTPKDGNSSSLTQDEKLRRRREFHNAVERRRRELIKAKIKELGTLVPPTLLHFDEFGRKVKPNKGTILNRTVEYMECLSQVLEIQDTKKAELKKKIAELEQKKLDLTKSTLSKNADGVLKGSSAYSEQQHPQTHSASSTQGSYTNDTDEYPEKIIDIRTYPMLEKTTPEDSNSQFEHGNRAHLHDDLQQFLSGTLMENEDNNKLMFNNHSDNPVDMLLDFEQ